MSVTETTRPWRMRLGGPARLGAAALGVGLVVPLVVACLLEPDPHGRGTHQQLGLPPCSIVVLFGRPCPTCGMTTAWANVVRGRWTAAFRAHVGGTLLCLLDVVAVPWLLVSAMRGRWLGGAVPGVAGPWIAVVVALVTLVEWLWRLYSA